MVAAGNSKSAFVIAVEVEKVIAALGSKGFNRDSSLRSLDRFYRAIEEAARGLEGFSEKQHFLNTVYERFFQGTRSRSPTRTASSTRRQGIVDFMCANVAEVLQTELGKGLGDRKRCICWAGRSRGCGACGRR